MTTIVVGYVPKAEGRAALRRAAEEATLRDAKLVVVNSHRGGRGFDSDEAAASDAALTEVREQLDSTGVPYEVRQLVRGLDPAEDDWLPARRACAPQRLPGQCVLFPHQRRAMIPATSGTTTV